MNPAAASLQCRLAPPTIAALPPNAHQLLVAIRAAIVIQGGAARGGDGDPAPRLSGLLGSGRAAAALLILIEAVGSAWPDPVAIYRPCARGVTHDELTLLRLIGCASRTDWAGADVLLRDYLPADARACLFHAASRLCAATD